MNPRFLLKLAIAIALAAVAVLLLGGGWLVWKRPLTVDAWMSRLALRHAGLRPAEVSASAGDMTVWEGGSGPPMVLLHGAGDQAGAWGRVVGPLAARHRLVIPDLPGHWHSPPTKGPLHVAQVLDGVRAVMDSCCTDQPAILVGNSLGAWVAFLYAREHPERVARIVAVNGGPLMGSNTSVNLLPADREEARKTMRALMGPNSQMVPGFVLDDVARHARTGPVARLAATAAEMPAYLMDGHLDEIQVPVEVVWGAADGLMDVNYARRLVDGLPSARLHLVAGCGHVPQRECPDRFLKALGEALDEQIPLAPEAPGPPAGAAEETP